MRIHEAKARTARDAKKNAAILMVKRMFALDVTEMFFAADFMTNPWGIAQANFSRSSIWFTVYSFQVVAWHILYRVITG